MRSSLFILFVLFTGIGNLNGQTSQAFKYVKVDTAKTVSSGEVVKIADRFFKKYYPLIYDAKEKMYVDGELKKLDQPQADKFKLATGLSSTSVIFTGLGLSQNTPVVFAAKAAALFPKDTLIVNNFGAVLRMLDSLKTSVTVLLYAKSLCPDAPVILTNLGNSLFEMYDDRSAEAFFNKALKVNPDYELAHQGLVSVYLKRKDLKKAIEELFRGVKGIYSESLGKTQEMLARHDNYAQPQQPPGEETSSGSQGQSAPNPGVPYEMLRLPRFPSWPEVNALLNDNSIKKVQDQIAAGSKAASEKMLNDYSKISGMNQQQQAEWAKTWMEKENKTGRVLYSQNEFGMKLLQEYFEDQLNKANKKYLYSDSINTKRMEKYLDQITSGDEERMKQAGANLDQVQAMMIERCKKITNLIRDTYSDWRNYAADRHYKYDDALTTYWIYCEQYLNRTYDREEFEKLNNQRKFYVYSQFSLLYMDYSMRQFMFAAMNMSAFATISGDCPKTPPKNENFRDSDDDVEVPDKDPIPCPFEKGKAKLGLGACSMGLDCENIEAECGEGVIGAVKWNYKKKEMTVFGGVGGKAEFGFKRNGASLEAKSGVELTFNTKGQIVDAGVKTEFGAKASLGSFEAGQTLELKATAATGINTERTNELSYSMF